MIEFVSEYILPYLICTIVIFIVTRFLTSKLTNTELDVFATVNSNVAFSTSLLFIFYLLGLVNLDDLLQIIGLYFSFYLGIYLSSLIWQNKFIFYLNNNNSIQKVFIIDNLGKNNILTIGLILFVITAFFAIILLLQGEASDDRVVFAKAYRWINIVLTGSQTIFIPYAIGHYLVKKTPRVGVIIILNVICSFFSGSKGFIIQYIITFFMMNTIINGKKSWLKKIKLKYIFLLITLLVSPIAMIMFWRGEGFYDAAILVLDRLYASGDIYYYSFVAGDYTKLFGEYNFISYLLHPFTSIIGIRGYEWPIGSELFAMANKQSEVLGYGPNPHLPILSLVILNGNFLLAIIFCFFVGVFVTWSRLFSLRIMQITNIPPFWRIAIFSLFFMFSPLVVIDIAQFQFMLVGVLFVIAILSMIYKIMGLKYSKESEYQEYIN
jgi:hypothetical protein